MPAFDKFSSYQSLETHDALELETDIQQRPKPSGLSLWASRKNVVVLALAVMIVSVIVYASSAVTREYSNKSIEGVYAENFPIYGNLDETAKQALYHEYIKEYGRSYSSVEYSYRYELFKKRLQLIDESNKLEVANGGTAVYAINQFADLSQEEFEGFYLNARVDDALQKDATDHLNRDVEVVVGASTYKNWAGIYTTAVKNQKNCGACWAFAVTEQVESDAIRLLNWNISVQLSPQQLVDCDTKDYACNGGSPYNAYDYIKTNGLERTSDYPYTSGTTKVAGTCLYSSYTPYVSITGYTFMNNGDSSSYASTEIAMANYVLTTGPLAAMAAATSWLSYSSGILSSCTGSINHVAQVVGIDTANSYWIIRNSWGKTWGNSGYIYITYGVNLCYIAAYPSYVAPKLLVTSSPTKAPVGGNGPRPTPLPTKYPTRFPTKFPTKFPTNFPTKYPTKFPTKFPV